ncbi:copper resistance CopC/CopD family protein [Conexibacter sp. DBS9H8]|uniref:copper resistance CopC/CopD family protein n=1 Tax=Conexibacter sp. DBS9H8 TaxID=2937801 RepID=UPI00200DBEF6|nr:copper resistance protein CopC [Conexibacter sp. DBS9H8]
MLLRPAPAAAHAFLIRSTPTQGARLARAPRQLTLDFSVAVVPTATRVSVRDAAGARIPLSRPTVQGNVAVQRLPTATRGVYVVSWRVVSSGDGHLTVGEFAFAAGSGAVLPHVLASGAQIGWGQAVASWLLFAGLALALGGTVSERAVWRIQAGRGDPIAPAPVRIGIALAMAASLALMLLLAHAIAGGGILPAFSSLGAALRSRSGALTLLLFAALVVAAWIGLWRRQAAVAPLIAAILATAWRGHSGSSGHAWAVAANTVHLTAAAVWTGALAHLVLVISRGRRALTAHELHEPLRRYARLALWTVSVMLGAGVITALAEFQHVGQLVDTSYGNVLLAKGALGALALATALAARKRALPSNSGLRLPLLRRLTRGELGLLAGVLLAAGVLANTAPPQPAVAASPAAARRARALLGPPPVTGPTLQLADLAGQLVVGVTATSEELRFAVLPPTETPGPGIRLTANAVAPGTGPAGVDLFPRPCGTTCFTLHYALRRGITALTVTASDPPWKGGSARIEIPWPPGPNQPALLARVTQTMRAIPRLALTETVTSGPGSHVLPDHTIVSGQDLISQVEAYAAGASDVHILRRHDGQTELAFALPASEIWYRMTIDSHDRVLRETIVDAPAHLIRNSFRYPPFRR